MKKVLKLAVTLSLTATMAVPAGIFLNTSVKANTSLDNTNEMMLKTPAAEVDKTALSNAISTAYDLEEADYTPTSWNAMRSEYDSAVIALRNTSLTQDQVDGIVMRLNGAVKALVKLSAVVAEIDKTALSTAIATAGALEEADYTPTSWKAMRSEYDSAIIALHNTSATQAEVDGIVMRLNGAVKALVNVSAPTVAAKDKTALSSAITTADGLKEADYTLASWNAMRSYYDSAVAVLKDTSATQEQVDGAVLALNGAIKGLVKATASPTVEIDKTALSSAITAAYELAETDYTPASWNAMRDVFDHAVVVLHDASATQEQVDGAVLALNGAVKGLVKATVQPAVEIDKTALSNTVTAAYNLVETDYTPVSWNAMHEVFYSAVIVLHDTSATQADVDKANTALQKAVAALVKNIVPEPTQGGMMSIDTIEGVGVKGNFDIGTILNAQPVNLNVLANKITDKTFLSKVTLEKAFDISLMKDGVKALPNGEVEVSIELDAMLSKKHLGIIYIDDLGNIQMIPSTIQGNKIMFKTTHFSTYAVVSYKDASPITATANTIVKTNTNMKKQASVNTGDETNTALYIVLILIAGASVALYIYRRKIRA